MAAVISAMSRQPWRRDHYGHRPARRAAEAQTGALGTADDRRAAVL
jgi:hypothetical protein